MAKSSGKTPGLLMSSDSTVALTATNPTPATHAPKTHTKNGFVNLTLRTPFSQDAARVTRALDDNIRHKSDFYDRGVDHARPERQEATEFFQR